MVQVIDNKDAAGESACIEFRVSLSPTDRTTVFGGMFFAESYDGGRRSPRILTEGKPGVPVEQAFLDTVRYADSRGISFMWIDDPRGLFPASKRPVP
jgi:hypothetical protein